MVQAALINYENLLCERVITPIQVSFVGFNSNLFFVKEKDAVESEDVKHPIILSHWRQMIEELEEAGYSIYRIVQLTGIPRRTVERWFSDTEDIPSYPLFSKMLCLYCYYKLYLKKYIRKNNAEQKPRGE